MLPFSLAVRFLRSGRGQTVLIVTGIAIAVAAQIFVGLLITSLQSTLVDRTVGNQPQITINPSGDELTVPDYRQKVDEIRQSGLVETVAAAASGNAFVREGEKTSPVLVRGIDNGSIAIYNLDDSLSAGSLPGPGEVLMGEGLREEFSYETGQEMTATTPSGQTGTYLISGFFDLGVAQLNETWLFTTLETAQELFGYGDGVTSIEMTVEDYFAADAVAAALGDVIDTEGVTITNWKEENEQLLSGLQGQSISSLMIQIFIIVSVVIAVAAILAITVFQKSRQLGILKAMGIRDRAASFIFIYEGLIIGLIGSILGIILGLLLLLGFSFGTSQGEGPALIDISIDYTFIAISWGIAVAAAVLAALIPARRSLRLNPIEVIREG